ncbi:MAG: STAS domain-containing protein [Ruminiclostridium sp.]|jgi:stage II sporulation protein AA (anti-sigma F factor antagonist)|nr:STAS domain-containing protein [Ruminiclostridium sp.]
MSVAYATHNRILTISLSGDIDHHRVKGLLQNLDQELDEVLPRQVVVNCSGVTFMDSSGIAILLRLRQRMEALSGTLQVTGLNEQPARVLRAAGLHRLIPIVE